MRDLLQSLLPCQGHNLEVEAGNGISCICISRTNPAE